MVKLRCHLMTAMFVVHLVSVRFYEHLLGYYVNVGGVNLAKRGTVSV